MKKGDVFYCWVGDDGTSFLVGVCTDVHTGGMCEGISIHISTLSGKVLGLTTNQYFHTSEVTVLTIPRPELAK